MKCRETPAVEKQTPVQQCIPPPRRHRLQARPKLSGERRREANSQSSSGPKQSVRGLESAKKRSQLATVKGAEKPSPRPAARRRAPPQLVLAQARSQGLKAQRSQVLVKQRAPPPPRLEVSGRKRKKRSPCSAARLSAINSGQGPKSGARGAEKQASRPVQRSKLPVQRSKLPVRAAITGAMTEALCCAM